MRASGELGRRRRMWRVLDRTLCIVLWAFDSDLSALHMHLHQWALSPSIFLSCEMQGEMRKLKLQHLSFLIILFSQTLYLL